MKHSFTVALTTVALLLVAIMAGMISLRLAIHGREVAVPDLAGLSDADAATAARKLGLNLSVENRFYSAAVAPNHVLSQAPSAGARVRRGWQVRVTESLGGQHVAAPDLTGEGERPALLLLSRLQLTLSPEAHLPAPGPSGVVLAQSPPPNTADATGPHVALLVSGAEADPATFAYVMPRITGMSIASAMDLLATAGLQLASAVDPNAMAAPAMSSNGADASPEVAARLATPGTSKGLPYDPENAPTAAQSPASGSPTPDDVKPAVPSGPAAEPTVDPTAIIATQYPPPGNRVTRADAIRVTVGHRAQLVNAAPAQTP